MSVADLLRSILVENAEVFSQIGFTWGADKTKEIKAFRETFPSGTKLPCITYKDISGVPGSLVNNDLSIQVSAWGSNEVECQTVANAVTNALESWSGTLSDVKVEKIVCTFWQDSSTEAVTSLWYSIRKFEIMHW